MEKRLGGWNDPYESSEKLTDVWYLPTSTGANGHGAEFPISLPGRCIALTTRPGDLVLDAFIGSGTTALAAMGLGRRCIGFDISHKYLDIARKRVKKLAKRLQQSVPIVVLQPKRSAMALNDGRASTNGRRPRTAALPL
jgi:DNA modification methylase